MLMVVGLNHKTAPVEIRERFWIGEGRRFEALDRLAHAPGIEEAVVLVTCNRTEFILWASSISLAAASVFHFLACEYGLRLCEWKHFYRRQGDEALLHIFRVTASLDSMVVGEPEITGQVKTAWIRAQQAGTTGRFLDAVFQKALHAAKRVRNETAIGAGAVSVPYAAVELARQVFGSISGRKVLILGAGKMGELAVRHLMSHGASAVQVTSRNHEHAQTLAEQAGGMAIPFEQRWQHLTDADIVITSTGCPHFIITREDAERIQQGRESRRICLIDISVPRNVDPAASQVPGVLVYDVDDLEQVVARNLNERHAAAKAAEELVAQAARGFRRSLDAERIGPTIGALRDRLEEIRRYEMERCRCEWGPLPEDVEQIFESVTARIVQRIASQLARELKEAPGRPEQDQLTAAVERLFGLERPQPALVN